MKVLVEEFNTADIWRLTGTVKLRIYANQSFWTSDGQFIPQGTPGVAETAYLEIACTVLANVLTVGGFEIDSTVDALDNPWATYTAELVAGNRRIPFLSTFAVNTLQVGDPSTTWAEIILLRNMLEPQTLTESLSRQIAGMIQLAVGQLNKGSETNTGVVALSTNPTDPTFPIAVSETDPRWQALTVGSFTFLSGYDSLAAAVAALGATQATLVVNAVAPVAADLTIPANITLMFIGAGMVQPANGMTLTIVGPIVAPPVKIFDNAVFGQGTILFTSNRSLWGTYPQWWGAIADDNTDCTPAIQAAIDAFDASNLSGTVWFVPGIYRLAGPLLDILESNAQLLLPRRTNAMLSIRLAGTVPAQTIAFKRDSQGAVLKSTLAAGSGAVIGGKVGGGAGWPVAGTSWVSVTIENLAIRTVANPTYSAVDLTYMPNVRVLHFQIGTDEDIITSLAPTYGITEPTTSSSYAIKLAPNNVPDASIVDDLEIYGFYNGMLAGELCNVDNLIVAFCKRPLIIPTALHAMRFGRVEILNYSRAVVFTGGDSYVEIAQLDLEKGPGPAWADLAVDIDDPNNFGHGKVCWHISAFGAVSHTLNQTGAFFLWTESLGNIDSNHSSSPMVIANRSVNQTIPDSVFTNVLFDTNESDDPFGMHSVIANTDRLVPSKEGIAEVRFTAMFAANATGTRQVRIYKHSGALGIDILLEPQNVAAIAGVDKSIKASVLSRATDPGDYFFVQVFQTSGGPLDLTVVDFRPRMSLNITR